MLRVAELTKRFGSVTALDGVDFEVSPGEIVGFLGPNGAGKTTTMRAIMGLITLDHGTVTWAGRTVDPQVRQRFGYMPAERGMYQRMKVREHLVYYATMCGLGARSSEAAEAWLERLGLTGRADDTVQSLSSGNQQRVQLALALINEPDLLVLDEPFSGLDPIAADTLNDVLRQQVERGAALLLSSHQLDLVAEVCTSVVIVDEGRMVLRGEVAELRSSSPTRHLDIEFSAPTPFDLGPELSTTDGDGRRYRVELSAGVDPAPLLERARCHGEVLSYSFAPPGLSEVFLAAIGRPRDVLAAEQEELHG